METLASHTNFQSPEFNASEFKSSFLSRPSALTTPVHHLPKLHLTNRYAKTLATSLHPPGLDAASTSHQLHAAHERTRVLQKAVMTEIKHHMDELLTFDDNDPFFNVFVEYHTQRIYSLQKALSAAFPESNTTAPATTAA